MSAEQIDNKPHSALEVSVSISRFLPQMGIPPEQALQQSMGHPVLNQTKEIPPLKQGLPLKKLVKKLFHH